MSLICVLGRQPALGLAELESRFGVADLSVVRPDIAQLEIAQDPAIFEQLGGTQKAGVVLAAIGTTDWHKISLQLKRIVSEILDELPTGKVTLGISTYGLKTNPSQINATALALKKVIKATGRPARVVPNKEVALNTAQVLHNKLALSDGIELLLVQDGSRTLVARTNWVQNIEAYRRRDQERPHRDARVGMLPPKLAQIIINLAAGSFNTQKNLDISTSLKFNETNILDNSSKSSSPILLDPFCGTGVILQEAWLMRLNVKGTDLEPRMVEYTNRNLTWLNNDIPAAASVADATKHSWKHPFDLVASETYLGRPLSSLPDQQTLLKIIHGCNVINKKFLQNLAGQTRSGFRLCVAVPAWRIKSGFERLPLLDHLEELGYNRISFSYAKISDLIYHREGQIVARELVVLTRK